MDAGADWNGDGLPDVVLGGGAKVDLEQQSELVDEKEDAVTIFLGGTDSTLISIMCPPEPPEEGEPPSLQQPLQYADVRLRGVQFDDGTNTASNKDNWMLSDRFGWCVRFVGDINGPETPAEVGPDKSYADLAVGAPWYDVEVDAVGGGTQTLYQAGAVYLYLGLDQPTGDPNTPPGDPRVPIPRGQYAYAKSDDLTSAGGFCDLIILGEGAGDYFGYAISKEIDFDGDGIPDLAIGAPQYAWQSDVDPTAMNTNAAWPNLDDRTGKVYVVLGVYLRTYLASAPSDPTLSITEVLSSGGGYLIQDSASGQRDRFGASLDGIGEHDPSPPFTGDELVIGAPQFRSDWNIVPPAGSAQAYKKTPQELDDDADGGQGYVSVWSLEDMGSGASVPVRRGVLSGPVEHPQATESELRPRYGWSVARVATGREDMPLGFAVGAPEFNTLIDPVAPGAGFLSNVGLVQGCAFDPGNSSQPISVEFSFTGYQASAEFGFSLSSGGDYNVDAIPDLIVGSRRFTRLGVPPACSCSSGRPSLAGRVDVLSWTQIGPTPRSRILAAFYGEEARDRLGFSSAFLGPVTGLPGQAIVASALAWPALEAPSQVTSGLCAECSLIGAACTTYTELGRAYLLHKGLGQ